MGSTSSAVEFAMRFKNRQRGATAVEYAIMIGGIAMAIILAVAAFGGSVQASFSDSQAKIAAAMKQ